MSPPVRPRARVLARAFPFRLRAAARGGLPLGLGEAGIPLVKEVFIFSCGSVHDLLDHGVGEEVTAPDAGVNESLWLMAYPCVAEGIGPALATGHDKV